MNTSHLIIIGVLIILFFIGFVSGTILRKSTYDEVKDEFQSQVVDLQKDIQKAEFVNRKLKMVFQTVEEKNNEIKQKNEVIKLKESEISSLSQKISVSESPAIIKKLSAELNTKNKELEVLRLEFQKVSQEAMEAQRELSEANKLLREKNDKIVELSNQLSKGGGNISKDALASEISEVKGQIGHYEAGSKFEFQADNYKGSAKRKNKDRAYHSAYYHFQQAGAKFDMERVYAKILSQEVRDKIDAGGDLSDGNDLFKDFEKDDEESATAEQ